MGVVSILKIIWLCSVLFVLQCYQSAVAVPATELTPIRLMWQVGQDTKDEELDLLKQSGINTIQSFGLTDWTELAIQKYLDRVDLYGLKVIVYLGWILDRDASKAHWSFGESAQQFVLKWKAHPAIYAWHTFDEPKEPSKRASKIDQESVYARLKNIDPSKPVMVSGNFTNDSDYSDYFSEKAFDMLELHAYIDDVISARQQILIDLFLSHHVANYPVIITLRAYNGEGRATMTQNSLAEQYQFFFKQNNISNNVGFYGWRLSPNRGIWNDPHIKKQFMSDIKSILIGR